MFSNIDFGKSIMGQKLMAISIFTHGLRITYYKPSYFLNFYTHTTLWSKDSKNNHVSIQCWIYAYMLLHERNTNLRYMWESKCWATHFYSNELYSFIKVLEFPFSKWIPRPTIQTITVIWCVHYTFILSHIHWIYIAKCLNQRRQMKDE